MRQGVKEIITAIKDAEQAVCPGSCRDVVLATIAKRVWLVSVVVMFLQDSVTHPRHFLFVAIAIANGLIGRAMLRATHQTAKESGATGFVAGSQ